jgi:hypothetical protein
LYFTCFGSVSALPRLFLRCTSAILFFAAAASRRRGNDLGTMIKYLRKTTNGAASIGLGTTVKCPRRKEGTATDSDLGTTLNYLRGAAGNDRAQRSSTCDAQRAAPRTTAWSPRPST